MKNKDISNIVNDHENITFYPLIQILARVNIKVLFTLIGMLLTYSFAVWIIVYKDKVRHDQNDQTAIDWEAPFTLILKDDTGQSKIHEGLDLMPDSETEDNTIFVVKKREPIF